MIIPTFKRVGGASVRKEEGVSVFVLMRQIIQISYRITLVYR